MTAIQWLLEKIGRRLVEWSSPPAPGARIETPSPPAAASAEPFDAKQHWLDRVAHLPPQAWQGGGRPAAPRPTAEADAAARGRSPAPLQRGLREAGAPMPPAARDDVAAAGDAPRRGAALGERESAPAPAVATGVRANPADVRPATRDRAVPPTPSSASASTAVVVDRATPERSPVSLYPPPESLRPASHPAPPDRPVERAIVVLPQPADAPSLPSPTPARLAETRDSASRIEPPRRAAQQQPPREQRSRDADDAIAVEPPPSPSSGGSGTRSRAAPIAGFDARRAHAPDLPQAPWPQPASSSPPPVTVPMPRPPAPLSARRNERREADPITVDPNPPAHGWPDLPPWPAPRDAQPRGVDPHARQRRLRLEQEQRG